MSRRARACVCSRSSRSFLCPPHSVPLSRKNEGKVEWVFSQKDSSNPFSVRAHVSILLGFRSEVFGRKGN